MKLLLDTHVFLWYIAADSHLPAAFREAISNRSNEVYLSVASVWEVIIKHSLGKLSLPETPAIYLPRQRETHRILSLPIDESALAQLANIPHLHRDPFDRIMIAQALQHGFTFVTVDDAIRAYPIQLLSSE